MIAAFHMFILIVLKANRLEMNSEVDGPLPIGALNKLANDGLFQPGVHGLIESPTMHLNAG
jgi:hypothetical protein